MLKENLQKVESKISASCDRSGRRREDVTLIAVSKTKPVETLKEAYDMGIRVFGENKVQELIDKYEALPKDIHWHMIGHLQRNKVKYIIDKVDLIHSVDSVRLAETIDKEAKKHNLTANIIRVLGLMTIAPFVENAEENRAIFSRLHKLSVDIASKNIDNVNVGLLSMGMTNDYEVAIEEGATMIRVGTGIFGERDYSHV